MASAWPPWPRKIQKVRAQRHHCRRKELMANVRKPREKLCASAFHLSKTRKKGTQSGRLRRPLCVQVFRVLERWHALAHSFSRGVRTRPINYCPRQYDGPEDRKSPNTCSQKIVSVLCCLLLVTCRSRVICKNVASRSGTIGAQSEN